MSSHAIYLPVYQRDKSYNKKAGLRLEVSFQAGGSGGSRPRGGGGGWGGEVMGGSCFLFA